MFSTSSPTYPASVSVVASAMVNGTSRMRASVCASSVLPEPVGPISRMLDLASSKRAEIDPELRRRRGVDQPQSDPPARFSPDDLWIGQGAVVGKECVVVDVVQVHRHAGPHVHGAHAPRVHVHVVAHATLRYRTLTAVGLGQSGEQLVRRVEAE